MRLLRLIFALLMGIIAPFALAQSNTNPIRVPALVEDAEISLTADGGLELHVTGILGTGCEAELLAEQTVDGSTLNVRFFQEVAPDLICPMIAISFDETVRLDVPPGVLRVVVNDDETFDLPGAQAAPVALEVETQRFYTVIESIEVTSPNTILVTGYQPDSCEFPVQVERESAENIVRFTIYRNVPINVRCNTTPVPYEQSLDLPDLANLLTYLEVNEFAIATESGEALTRVLLPIESYRVATDESPATLIVMWGDSAEDQTPACDLIPVFNRIRHHPDNILEIQVYQWHYEMMSCPLAFGETTEIPLPAELEPGLYRYRLNDARTGAFILKERDPMDDYANRVPHLVEKVTPQVDGQNVSLNVTGIIPDGCETEVFVDTDQSGQAFTVEIYRQIPPGIGCAAIVLDFDLTVDLGTLDAGDYTATVNGVEAEFTVNP